MANQIDIITTSLEALIQRATNVSNQNPDVAAIEAFCGLVAKEPESVQMAAKFISAKVHSLQEWEALQALSLLESCMRKCGSAFQSEIGKFRFLNELIKLVSPKYLGEHTPEPVRKRVLELMYTWTIHYPRETKIKEAYDMLKKQGVVPDEPPCHVVKESNNSRQATSILQDEETSQLLQKLLQSKNPQDLQAANKLIKSMVKEEERRVEEKWRYKVELQKVINNCSLLNEMLDSYQVGVTSEQELELIVELYNSCQSLRPVLFKLANVNTDPVFCTDVLTVNDELGDVFTKYNSLIVGKNAKEHKRVVPAKKENETSTSLLDLTPSPSVETVNTIENLAGLDLTSSAPPPTAKFTSNSLEALRDVFSEIVENPSGLAINQLSTLPNYSPPFNDNVLNLQGSLKSTPIIANKTLGKDGLKSKGLEELDILSENLIKQSLSSSSVVTTPKIMGTEENGLASGKNSLSSLVLEDDLLLDLPDVSEPPATPLTSEKIVNDLIKKKDNEVEITTTHLGDIKITLETIKHSSVSPFQVLDSNGINVALHLAKDCPRPDVTVFVVTASSKNENPLDNFLFQPVVPKCCRLRLMPPSSTTLPAYNPFLPPSAITQLMLIASSAKEPITLKYVVSYSMEEETITEMGEVEKLLMKEQ